MRRLPAVRRTLVLRAARRLSPSVRELTFDTDDGAPFDRLAGQWVKLFLADGLERDYSIADAFDPQDPGRVTLAVTRVEGGPGSEALHRMEPGTRVDSLGPNGLFVRTEAERAMPALYVGTGTGLAPLRAMLQEELARGEGPPQTLLFGGRTEDDRLWADELARVAVAFPRLQVVTTLSRPGAAWTGPRGHVQAHLPARLAATPGAHVYVCGLSSMVLDVRRLLKETLGVDRRNIHSERYD